MVALLVLFMLSALIAAGAIRETAQYRDCPVGPERQRRQRQNLSWLALLLLTLVPALLMSGLSVLLAFVVALLAAFMVVNVGSRLLRSYQNNAHEETSVSDGPAVICTHGLWANEQMPSGNPEPRLPRLRLGLNDGE